MAKKCKFRFHRGTLKESLESLYEISNKNELCRIINQQYGITIKVDDIAISYYAKDTRINENCYAVTVNDLGIVGFTNADLD